MSKIKNDIGNQDNQFNELMKEIGYACRKVKTKKWNLAQYHNYMADFFDYLGLPADAVEHKHLADKWILDNSV